MSSIVTSRPGQQSIMTVRDCESPSSPTSDALTPSMSAVMEMTAAMPMTMPRIVRRLRPRFAWMAEKVS